ncbi:hypothetical protein ACWERI_38080 [Streptomyces collinus]
MSNNPPESSGLRPDAGALSSPVRQERGRLLRVLSSDATRGSLEGHAALAFKNGHRVTAFHPRDEWRPAPRGLRLSARSDPRPAERMARLLSRSPWSADRDDDATVAVLPDGAGPYDLTRGRIRYRYRA